jgi:hypothetical protein
MDSYSRPRRASRHVSAQDQAWLDDYQAHPKVYRYPTGFNHA